MPASHPNPISLSDEQLEQVMAAAAVLHVADRSAFLESVAQKLRGEPELGDGLIARIVRDCQRELFRPPVDNVASKVPRHNGSYKPII
jgi:hypothetical protein